MTYKRRFPNAPPGYDAQNEGQFRAEVVRALQDGVRVAQSIVSSATGFPTSILGWSHTLAFSASDNDTVAWASGTIKLSDGTTYSIGAGNTGNMAATTYIFLDIAVSVTTLQTTTTATDAVGLTRILVAVAKNVASGKDATFQVFGGADDGDLALITADQIAADTITANEIASNTITANEIEGGTITADKLSVSELSAIAADLGNVTAGEVVIGSTNRIWLNDGDDGALNIGGSTKGSAPFQVDAAGNLTATSATIVGQVTGEVFSQVDVDMSTNVATGYTGGQQLVSLTVPAGALGTTRGVRWTIFGTASPSTSTVNLNFYLNDSDLIETCAILTSQPGAFKVIVECFNDGADDSQRVFVQCIWDDGAQVSVSNDITPAEDTSADLSLDVYVTLFDSGDSVTVYGTYVKYI